MDLRKGRSFPEHASVTVASGPESGPGETTSALSGLEEWRKDVVRDRQPGGRRGAESVAPTGTRFASCGA